MYFSFGEERFHIGFLFSEVFCVSYPQYSLFYTVPHSQAHLIFPIPLFPLDVSPTPHYEPIPGTVMGAKNL